jgi:hypothetical protein
MDVLYGLSESRDISLASTVELELKDLPEQQMQSRKMQDMPQMPPQMGYGGHPFKVP